jgi:hypothetical protein
VPKIRRYPSLRRRQKTALSNKFLSKLEKQGFHIIFMNDTFTYGGSLPLLDKKVLYIDSNNELKEFTPTKEKYTYEIPSFIYNAVDNTFDGVLEKTEKEVFNILTRINSDKSKDKYLIIRSLYNSKPGDKEQFFCRLILGAYSLVPLES